jgi:hypothetical protein
VLVFGLISDSGGWEPPEYEPEPERRPRKWNLPWRPLVWVVVWCWLMALVPVVNSAFGGLAGFGVLMLAVALVFWRLERWCARQYWHGLREYKL